MSSDSEQKNWWDNMDWNLAGSVQETLEVGQRVFRNLPSALSAHKLGQATPLNRMECDPVEKLRFTRKNAVPLPNPKMLLPPPKPACLEKKRNLEKSQQLRKDDIPEKPEENKADDLDATTRFTLEDLLTPDYCGYK